MKRHGIIAFFVLLLFLLTASGCAGSTQKMLISGQSMAPTLAAGVTVTVDNKAYAAAQPKRTDIVAFKDTGNITMIKRVIGLPGEKIELIDKKVYINGAELTESYLLAQNSTEPITDSVWLVPAKCVFVLGDNRMSSKDSRGIGFVPYDRIIGKVLN
jgi:signal peptidase I